MKQIENTLITYYEIGQTLKYKDRPPFKVIGFQKCKNSGGLDICHRCSGYHILPDVPDRFNHYWHDVEGDFQIL